VAYKLRVLDTVAILRQRGQGAVGAFLRREGLYYSSVHTWQRLRSQGLLVARRRGPHEKSREALQAENKQLRRKLEQTQKRLVRTALLVELQKKLSAFMETHESAETSAGG
jgi:hypothetical protein